MLLNLVFFAAIFLSVDCAGFWYLDNTIGQFSGKNLPFSYAGTLFPRVLLIIVGVPLIAWGMTGDRQSLAAITVGGAFCISSHLVLYYRAFLVRKEERDLEGD
jgi:hypothetical protein